MHMHAYYMHMHAYDMHMHAHDMPMARLFTPIHANETRARRVKRACMWKATLTVIPNRQIIFMNTGEYGVCNILITATPFVI